MDEAAAQLLHEFYHETAKHMVDMASESSAPTPVPTSSSSTPSPSAADQPPPHTAAQAQAQAQAQSQSSIEEVSHLFPPMIPTQAVQQSLIMGRFSDLTILYGETGCNAHKIIVCSQSPVLEARVIEYEEGSQLDLTEYDSALMAKVLQYLYTGSYSFPLTAPTFSLPLHISLFILSITLQISGLESLSSKNFRDCLSEHVSDLDTYFNAIASIYQRTNPEHPALRNAVVEAAVCELGKILSEGAVKDRFLEVLARQEEFLGDLLKAMISAREVETEVQVTCEECGPVKEAYQIVVSCKGCGALKMLEFL